MRGMLSRLVLSSLCACLCAAAVASAQEGGGAPAARKFDEFGRLYGCDAGARLDSFAVELQSTPSAKAYIVAREARDKPPGAARAWGASFIHYFVNLRGLEAPRFVLVEGAPETVDDLKMELWLVPEGAEPPRVKPPGKHRSFSGKYAELHVYDEKTFHDFDEVSAGSFTSGMYASGYESLLKRQEGSQGYLVVYSPPDAEPGYWRRAGTREQQKLLSRDLAADRLTIINGGTVPAKEKPAEGDGGEQIYGRVELWVGAKDGPPVKHVEEEAALTQALLVGNDDLFSNPNAVGPWVLNNLVDMMRVDKRSLGCIVVYPGDGDGIGAGEDAGQAPPDPFKAAERWKAELLKKHGFEAHRVVILNGPQVSYSFGRLEVWAVPYGAALPDPFKEEGAATDEEEEGEGGGQQQPPPPSSTGGVNLKWQLRF